MNCLRRLAWSCVLVLGMVTAALAVPAKPGETRLLRYPDISKDQVVFAYAGDLWVVPRAGGEARRLTAHPGDEIFPKFSPDGKWIAFTGEYDGNPDVYVVPSEGGEPRRLTYHPASDQVLGWTPDGSKILFRSGRMSAPVPIPRLFLVSPHGGLPEVLPPFRASLSSFSPDGQRIAYNPTSVEFRTWKRYRGGWASYIAIYDLKKNTYEELPRTKAIDFFPMWHGNAIYFLSDRDGIMNLYRYDLGSKQTRPLTHYRDMDIKWPSLGPDAIVYENDGRLYEFNLESEKSRAIPINVPSDLTLTRAEIKPVGDRLGSFSLSPSGVRALVEARGDIFTIPAEHGDARNLTQSPGVHELNPAWSPDGQWVAYLSDRTGEYEIYLRPQKGGDEVRITTDGGCYRFGPRWSPDSKKLLYWDKKLRVWYVDITAKQPVLIDQAERFGLDEGWKPSWSPDSRWVAYSKTGANFADSLYLYSLEQKKVFHVTEGFYNDVNPVFDPEGKYLYFLSARFFHPLGDDTDNRFSYHDMYGVFALTLQASEAAPFGPQDDEEKAEGEKGKKEDKSEASSAEAGKKDDEAKSEEKKVEKKEEKKEIKPIKIDVEGLGERLSPVPIPPGSYTDLQVRKEKLFYLSQAIEAQQAGQAGPPKPSQTLHLYDVKNREDKPLLEGIDAYGLDKDGGKVIYRAEKVYGVVEATPGKAKLGEGKLNTAGLQALVDPRAEWRELFHEAWRIERDFYWDPNMGGLNWDQVGQRYEALLPWVAHRSDLNYILGDMIAELSTSHTYVGGGEMPQRLKVGVGMLGVDFTEDHGYYRLAKIYRGENWNEHFRSPLTEPGLKVKEGDYLLAVNGLDIKPPTSPYAYFQGSNDKIVTLKINDQPRAEGAWDITVKTVGDETELHYLDWVESRRKIVDQATGGRVAYMHVPNTAIEGLIMFEKYLTGQLGKEALIVDERYNGGGMIPDFFTSKLQRRLLNLVAPREGKDQPWPPEAIYGPKVMLVNEMAGSGGDAFPWYFQQEKIGPIVGERTWGGLIGISRGIPMMDGGFVTAPEIAFWSPEKGGQWIVENHGVDPDYVVAQRPDLVRDGHDPQLEKAIQLVMEALKSYKLPPPRPAYPKKN
ncbi:MAG: PDZ domain-containing protein [Acidobacteriia bacterium]|nr:PDZ domain-containing protein [Terriglobia bacterium]